MREPIGRSVLRVPKDQTGFTLIEMIVVKKNEKTILIKIYKQISQIILVNDI